MNWQIEDLFQGLTYSGVSKANNRASLRMSQGQGFKEDGRKNCGLDVQCHDAILSCDSENRTGAGLLPAYGRKEV
jgi:hypothetical protein